MTELTSTLDAPQLPANDAELPAYCPASLRESVESLLPLYYEQLKRMARKERGRLSPLGTLNTTAVVHEAYLRMAQNPAFASREHFLRTSVIAMRYVLIDRVRAQLAAKRGGREVRVDLEQLEREGFVIENDVETLAVHEALERLEAVSPKQARIAECRYFAGYTDAEIAEATGSSVRTVRRDWALAKAWLMLELGQGSSSQA